MIILPENINRIKANKNYIHMDVEIINLIKKGVKELLHSPLGGLIGVFMGAWIAFHYQKKAIVRNELKEIRTRTIFIKANLEAYEYILLAQYEDYVWIAYRYASAYTFHRFNIRPSSNRVNGLALELESIRMKYENMMFEFRKLISELKGLTNKHNEIEKLMQPFINEEFNTWNLKFNTMMVAKEFTDFMELNKEDEFGQGGDQIEPTLSTNIKKKEFVDNFTKLYSIADYHINKLIPKDLMNKI
jgi:hypothetical protein